MEISFKGPVMPIDPYSLEKPNKFDPFGQKELTLLATI